MESKKQKIAEGKTPVTLLHERLIRTGNKPIFELVYDSTSRPTCITNFTYVCKVGDIEQHGTATTKKAAKQAAAKAMLMAISGDDDIEMLKALQENRNAKEDKFLNQVGNLSTFCARNNLPAPDYDEDHDEDRPSHQMKFYCKCKVGNRSEIGVANSRRGAKHSAAQAMFNRLVQEIDRPNDPDLPDYKLNSDNQLLKLKKADPWPENEMPPTNDDDGYDAAYEASTVASVSNYSGDRSEDLHYAGEPSDHFEHPDEHAQRIGLSIVSEEVLEHKYKLRLLELPNFDITAPPPSTENSEVSGPEHEHMTSEYGDDVDPEETKERKTKLVLLDLGDRDIVNSVPQCSVNPEHQQAPNETSSMASTNEYDQMVAENQEPIDHEETQERKTKLRLLDLGPNFDIMNPNGEGSADSEPNLPSSAPNNEEELNEAEKEFFAEDGATPADTTEAEEDLKERKTKLRLLDLENFDITAALEQNSGPMPNAEDLSSVPKVQSSVKSEGKYPTEQQTDSLMDSGESQTAAVPKFEKNDFNDPQADDLEQSRMKSDSDLGTPNAAETMEAEAIDVKPVVKTEVKKKRNLNSSLKLTQLSAGVDVVKSADQIDTIPSASKLVINVIPDTKPSRHFLGGVSDVKEEEVVLSKSMTSQGHMDQVTAMDDEAFNDFMSEMKNTDDLEDHCATENRFNDDNEKISCCDMTLRFKNEAKKEVPLNNNECQSKVKYEIKNEKIVARVKPFNYSRRPKRRRPVNIMEFEDENEQKDEDEYEFKRKFKCELDNPRILASVMSFTNFFKNEEQSIFMMEYGGGNGNNDNNEDQINHNMKWYKNEQQDKLKIEVKPTIKNDKTISAEDKFSDHLSDNNKQNVGTVAEDSTKSTDQTENEGIIEAKNEDKCNNENGEKHKDNTEPENDKIDSSDEKSSNEVSNKEIQNVDNVMECDDEVINEDHHADTENENNRSNESAVLQEKETGDVMECDDENNNENNNVIKNVNQSTPEVLAGKDQSTDTMMECEDGDNNADQKEYKNQERHDLIGSIHSQSPSVDISPEKVENIENAMECEDEDRHKCKNTDNNDDQNQSLGEVIHLIDNESSNNILESQKLNVSSLMECENEDKIGDKNHEISLINDKFCEGVTTPEEQNSNSVMESENENNKEPENKDKSESIGNKECNNENNTKPENSKQNNSENENQKSGEDSETTLYPVVIKKEDLYCPFEIDLVSDSDKEISEEENTENDEDPDEVHYPRLSCPTRVEVLRLPIKMETIDIDDIEDDDAVSLTSSQEDELLRDDDNEDFEDHSEGKIGEVDNRFAGINMNPRIYLKRCDEDVEIKSSKLSIASREENQMLEIAEETSQETVFSDGLNDVNMNLELQELMDMIDQDQACESPRSSASTCITPAPNEPSEAPSQNELPKVDEVQPPKPEKRARIFKAGCEPPRFRPVPKKYIKKEIPDDNSESTSMKPVDKTVLRPEVRIFRKSTIPKTSPKVLPKNTVKISPSSVGKSKENKNVRIFLRHDFASFKKKSKIPPENVSKTESITNTQSSQENSEKKSLAKDATISLENSPKASLKEGVNISLDKNATISTKNDTKTTSKEDTTISLNKNVTTSLENVTKPAATEDAIASLNKNVKLPLENVAKTSSQQDVHPSTTMISKTVKNPVKTTPSIAVKLPENEKSTARLKKTSIEKEGAVNRIDSKCVPTVKHLRKRRKKDVVSNEPSTSRTSIEKPDIEIEEPAHKKISEYFEYMLDGGVDLRKKAVDKICQLVDKMARHDVENNIQIIEDAIVIMGDILQYLDVNFHRVIYITHDGDFVIVIHIDTISEIVEMTKHPDYHEANKTTFFKALKRINQLLL